jgi:hypothetical protein
VLDYVKVYDELSEELERYVRDTKQAEDVITGLQNARGETLEAAQRLSRILREVSKMPVVVAELERRQKAQPS